MSKYLAQRLSGGIAFCDTQTHTQTDTQTTPNIYSLPPAGVKTGIQGSVLLNLPNFAVQVKQNL